MRRSLLNILNTPKLLRHALILITMLLLPNTAWGQNYDLWIGETQVTGTNASNITGNGITGNGTVSFEEPGTLTLNNATLTVGIKSSLSSLTIQLKGNSSIITNGSCIYTEGNTETLTIISGEQAGGDCSLTLQNKSTENSVIKGFTNMGEGSLTSSSNAAYNKDTKSLCSSTDNSKVITAVTYAANYYNISIGQTQIAKGIDNVVGEGITSGTVTFDGSTNTLTLDNAIIDHITSWIGNLTIKVKGANTISSNSIPIGSTSPENYSLTITKETDGDEASIDIINTTTANTAIFGFFSLTYTGFIPYDSNSDSKKFIALNYDSSSKELKNTSGSSINHVFFKEGSVYPLQIGDTQVTSENAGNILNDDKVSFTPANGYNASTISTWATLTLDNATINGSIEWSETVYPNLRIVVNGTCKVIKETEGDTPLPAIKYSGTGTPTVHISKNSTDATLLIASYKNKGTSNGSVFSGFNSTIGVDDGLHQTTLYPDDGENYQIRYTCYTTAKVYDLAVAGIQVHEISSDFQGYKEHILKGQLENSVYTRNTTVTFDGTQLTLNNAAIETSSSANAIITGLDLSINLIGTNTITTASGYAFSRNSQESRTVSFTSSSSPAGTLTLSKSLDPQGLTSGITLDTTGGWTVTYSGSATNLENATQAIITKGALTGIEIAGTLITSEYLDENGVISGVSGITPGTVKFTPAVNSTPATLTLNGAALTAPIIIGLSELTIDIQGTNSITTNTTCIQNQENTTPVQLTFKSTSAEVGSLTLTNTSDNSDGVINDKYFEKFTISNELALIMLRYGGYTSNTYYFTAGEVHNAQIVPSYGVQVESAQILQVYEGNANDILGDGTDTKEPTVSFDKTTNTLTLNGASGISNISTTLSTLNIELVGSNSLYRSSNGSIFDSSTGEAVTINLKSTGETKGILTIETESNSSAKFKGDNVTLTPVAPIVLLSGDLTTNSGTLEYGTLSAPTMSSETVDGVSTITLTSTADNSTIKYSIDYVDASQTDITDATYDSSNKPTINKPATVTAKVTLNEVESATTTGKYFDTDPSPFTLISGADPVNLVLTPAIDESDGISITSISGIESNVTYDAGTGKISSSTMGSFNGQVSMSSTDGKTVILNNNFTATFTVQIDISQAVITLDNTELIYNGNEQTVSVQKVMVGDDVVPQDYYEVSGNTGTEMGNYTLTVTAKTRDSQGNPFNNIYTGTATKVWKITNHYTATATELGFSTETQTASTYYNPSENFNLPEGYVGYIITGVEGSKVLTTRISYIPKGVAVLVEKGTSTENPIEEIPDASEQPLKGTSEPLDVTSITGGTVYVLYNGMFVKSTSGTIPEKRCYLLIATNVAAGTRSFSIDHGDGTTSLREVKSEEAKGEKWADGAWHDLQGRHLPAKPTNPGLYLHNGAKVVIK